MALIQCVIPAKEPALLALIQPIAKHAIRSPTSTSTRPRAPITVFVNMDTINWSPPAFAILAITLAKGVRDHQLLVLFVTLQPTAH